MSGWYTCTAGPTHERKDALIPVAFLGLPQPKSLPSTVATRGIISTSLGRICSIIRGKSHRRDKADLQCAKPLILQALNLTLTLTNAHRRPFRETGGFWHRGRRPVFGLNSDSLISAQNGWQNQPRIAIPLSSKHCGAGPSAGMPRQPDVLYQNGDDDLSSNSFRPAIHCF